MNYKLLTLCLSLMVAAVNASAMFPTKHPRSPDSTDATSAKRAAVTVATATADDTTATSAGNATPRPISIDGVDGPVQVTLSKMSLTQAIRQANLIVSTHLNRTTTITFTDLIPHTAFSDLNDDCLGKIFTLVCQSNLSGGKKWNSNTLRNVSKQWLKWHDDLLWPVKIALPHMSCDAAIHGLPVDEAIKTLAQCIQHLAVRPNTSTLSVSLGYLTPAPSLSDFWPVLKEFKGFDIELKLAPVVLPCCISTADKDILDVPSDLGAKITSLALQSENTNVTNVGIAFLVSKMPQLRRLKISYAENDNAEIPITKNGAEAMAYMTNLTDLSLSCGGSSIEPDALQIIVNMPSLRRLKLNYIDLSNLTNVSWDNARFTELGLTSANDASAASSKITTLHFLGTLSSRLISLNLCNSEIYNAPCAELAQMTQLRHLNISVLPGNEPNYDAQGLWALTRNPNWKTLKISTKRQDLVQKMRLRLTQTQITVVPNGPYPQDETDLDSLV